MVSCLSGRKAKARSFRQRTSCSCRQPSRCRLRRGASGGSWMTTLRTPQHPLARSTSRTACRKGHAHCWHVETASTMRGGTPVKPATQQPVKRHPQGDILQGAPTHPPTRGCTSRASRPRLGHRDTSSTCSTPGARSSPPLIAARSSQSRQAGRQADTLDSQHTMPAITACCCGILFLTLRLLPVAPPGCSSSLVPLALIEVSFKHSSSNPQASGRSCCARAAQHSRHATQER